MEDDWSELLPRVNLSTTSATTRWSTPCQPQLHPGRHLLHHHDRAGNLKYDSQTAWNYEVGAKTEWFGNRLRINPVLFYSEYSDLQEMAYDASTGNFIASNPGKKATAYGAELDMAWLILPGLEADATLGYTRARYDENTDPNSAASYDGNRMLMSPEYTARVGCNTGRIRPVRARGHELRERLLLEWGQHIQALPRHDLRRPRGLGVGILRRVPVRQEHLRSAVSGLLLRPNHFRSWRRRRHSASSSPTGSRRRREQGRKRAERTPVSGMGGGGYPQGGRGQRLDFMSVAVWQMRPMPCLPYPVHVPSAGGSGDGVPPDGCGLASGGGGRSRGAIPAEQTVVQGSR